MTPSRRDFLRSAVILPAILGSEEIVPGLSLLRGSVNTALFSRNGKKILIDSGAIRSLPGTEWILFTHHHPDQASGARHLAAAGAKVIVPFAEKSFFENAAEVWDGADARLDHDYNCRPDLLTLRDSVPIALALRNGEVHTWEGLKFEAIETPGHTDGSLTWLVEIGNKRIAFTGDLIYGIGQIHDMFSLQKAFPDMGGGYWGFGGAVEDVKASLDRVLARKPDLLVPSHGDVIREPARAAEELKRTLDAVMENYLTTAAWRANKPGVYKKNSPSMLDPLPAVDYPKWCRNITYTSKALVADDRSVFLSDCGSNEVVTELAKLQISGEIHNIDAVWITHYHDDHTEAVNLARRRFGCSVYAQRGLVDVLENPTAYQLPCLFPESIHVDRVLEDRETFDWKGFKLTAFFFPGQTLYHAGLLVERGGRKVFFTGDTFSSRSFSDVCSQNRNFMGRDVGIEKCCRILLETKPDLLITAHWGPLLMTEAYLNRFIELLQAREKLYEKLFPYDNFNFGLDPYWIRPYPFRQKALAGAPVDVEARVMNHSSKPKQVSVVLNLPDGWKPIRAQSTATVPPHSEGRLRLSAIAPAAVRRRRHILGLTAIVDARPLGEFAATIVDLMA